MWQFVHHSIFSTYSSYIYYLIFKTFYVHWISYVITFYSIVIFMLWQDFIDFNIVTVIIWQKNLLLIHLLLLLTFWFSFVDR